MYSSLMRIAPVLTDPGTLQPHSDLVAMNSTAYDPAGEIDLNDQTSQTTYTVAVNQPIFDNLNLDQINSNPPPIAKCGKDGYTTGN